MFFIVSCIDVVNSLLCRDDQYDAGRIIKMKINELRILVGSTGIFDSIKLDELLTFEISFNI